MAAGKKKSTAQTRRAHPKKKPATDRKAAMDDLVTTTLKAHRLADDLQLIHYAQGGMVRFAAEHNVEHELLEGYFTPLDEWIGRAYSDAADLTERIIDVGRRLHAMKGVRA